MASRKAVNIKNNLNCFHIFIDAAGKSGFTGVRFIHGRGK
jgi:hypothetical protein